MLAIIFELFDPEARRWMVDEKKRSFGMKTTDRLTCILGGLTILVWENKEL